MIRTIPTRYGGGFTYLSSTLYPIEVYESTSDSSQAIALFMNPTTVVDEVITLSSVQSIVLTVTTAFVSYDNRYDEVALETPTIQEIVLTVTTAYLSYDNRYDEVALETPTIQGITLT